MIRDTLWAGFIWSGELGQAARVARQISVHHQACRDCQRGGLLQVGPGGLARRPCPTERALFAALERARAGR